MRISDRILTSFRASREARRVYEEESELFPEEAERQLRNVASNLGLSIHTIEDEPVELSMLLPIQDELEFDVWCCLQNVDELWFCVGDFFTYSSFPFREVQEVFEQDLIDFLKGTSRIRRQGWVMLLEKPRGDEWVVAAQYRGGRLKGIANNTIIRNDPTFKRSTP